MSYPNSKGNAKKLGLTENIMPFFTILFFAIQFPQFKRRTLVML